MADERSEWFSTLRWIYSETELTHFQAVCGLHTHTHACQLDSAAHPALEVNIEVCFQNRFGIFLFLESHFWWWKVSLLIGT